MRLLFATLLAFALVLLPAAGVASASMSAGTQTGGLCHDMPVEHEMPADPGRSCAEHCMMQVSPLPALGACGQPSISNAIAAERALGIDLKTPRAGEPPDTPPPRS